MEETSMKINVTWADIANGEPAKTTVCMVALALKRELGISYASVGHREAIIRVDGQDVKVYLPREVEVKIRFWDRFHIVRPFQFELICSGFLTGSAIIAQPSGKSAPLCQQTSFA
jgi:hypothetical protein